jgi:hypothetical protein
VSADLVRYALNRVLSIYGMGVVCMSECRRRITGDCKRKYRVLYPWYLRVFGRGYREDVKKCVSENYDKCGEYCVCLIEDALHGREPSCTMPEV